MAEITVAWSPSSFAAADDAPLRLLESFGVEVRANPHQRRLTEAEAVKHLQGVHGLIAGLEPLTRSVLQSAADLRAVARVGIGMDNVDREAAEELGIKLSNTPDPPAEAVAELVVSAALALSRGLVETNAELHAGRWTKSLGVGLRGTTILLVGFGRIGRAVARRLLPFGPELLVCDPQFESEPTLDLERVTLHEGLERARIVSLHASGLDQILGPLEFEMIRPGGFLLNSARGELVDEDALTKALDEGRLAGAWFDVFWQEPYSGPLLEYDQVLLTPHMGTYTVPCRREMEMAATQNLLRDLGLSS
jgi:D-3-phosphoglycerate dehydrogenase